LGVERKENGEDLLGFVRKFTDQDTFTVEEDLGHGYVRLKVTEAERRQALQDIRCVEDVVKELVRNARDAGASNIYVTFQKEKGRWRNIAVFDDGSGIPASLHRRIFEARVTSKVQDVVKDFFGVHGRGMALYSIKQVTDDVHLVDSRKDCGTIISVRIDTQKLTEKKDQSTFPRLENNDEGKTVIAGGPRNVPRVLAEFSLSSNGINIFLGSNAEILATLYHHSVELRKSWATGTEDIARPLWFELGKIKEGRMLHAFASENLGINVSERNAFRILEFEINPLMSINELFDEDEGELPARRSDLHRQPKVSWSDHLARRLNQDDISHICDSLQSAFGEIGEKYYLQIEDPVVKRRKNRIIISLGLHETEAD
jgi:anti-sigma regulatory factor (Ser/Thr protein kinase)